jgi:hypothetical protein
VLKMKLKVLSKLLKKKQLKRKCWLLSAPLIDDFF